MTYEVYKKNLTIYQIGAIPTNYTIESKSAHLHFGKKVGSHTYLATHSMDQILATTENSIKDLGIYLSTNLKFIHHYKKITACTYRMLGLLRRTFTTPHIYARKQLAISCIVKITNVVLLTVVVSIPTKRY